MNALIGLNELRDKGKKVSGVHCVIALLGCFTNEDTVTELYCILY